MTPVPNTRCLIIDDEAPARAVIRKYLSDIPGYEILAECKNAFEANEAIQNLQPDLIFLDINMPKLIYKGPFTEKFIKDVQKNKYGLKEGVVCKSVNEKVTQMFKIKTIEWLEKVKEKFGVEEMLKY